MVTKFNAGDDVMCKGKVCIILAIQAYYWGTDELISYKLQGVPGWVYEQSLEVII